MHPVGAIAAISVVAAAATASAEEALTLTVGEARSLDAGAAVQRIVIDRPGVISAGLKSNSRVELTAVAPGEATVQLSVAGGAGEQYAVRVVPQGTRAAQALEQQLHAVAGLDKVQVSPEGGRHVLSGSVADLETHARLSEAAAGAGVEASDRVAVEGRQMVAIDVHFYAVAANTLNELGFNFSYLSGEFQGAVLSPNSLSDFTLDSKALSIEATPALQGAFNLLLARPQSGALGILSALSSAGLSQVLARPTLLVRSGEEADFLAGGDIPVPVPQGGAGLGAVGIEYRPYGVRLSVAPVVLTDRRISLRLSPEVSELDYSNQVAIQGVAVPSFRRRSATTTVELGDGQSFVIAGLTYMSGAETEAKTPGLGSLPVLGALFRTTQMTRERQELIIVATPRLVSPLDQNPLADVDLAKQPSLGDRLLGRGGTAERVKAFGLSR